MALNELVGSAKAHPMALIGLVLALLLGWPTMLQSLMALSPWIVSAAVLAGVS